MKDGKDEEKLRSNRMESEYYIPFLRQLGISPRTQLIEIATIMIKKYHKRGVCLLDNKKYNRFYHEVMQQFNVMMLEHPNEKDLRVMLEKIQEYFIAVFDHIERKFNLIEYAHGRQYLENTASQKYDFEISDEQFEEVGIEIVEDLKTQSQRAEDEAMFYADRVFFSENVSMYIQEVLEYDGENLEEILKNIPSMSIGDLYDSIYEIGIVSKCNLAKEIDDEMLWVMRELKHLIYRLEHRGPLLLSEAYSSKDV